MIETLYLKNFKRHAETRLTFAPLTILVGPNGSGKTSVLEALHLLGQLYSTGFDELFSGVREPQHLARHAEGVELVVLDASGTENEKSSGLRLELHRTPRLDEFGEEDEEGKSDWRPKISLVPARWATWDDPSEPLDNNGSSWPGLKRGVFFRLDARRIAAPSPASDRARVEYDGRGVATVLANLKLGDEARFENICHHLRQVVPQFHELRVLPTSVREDGRSTPGYSLTFKMDSGYDVRGSDLSEGTLLTLALLTALHAARRPRLVLLDDLHEALHPKAQSRLMKLLDELVAGPEPLQVIATTHSPYIVDCVSPEAVLAFAHRPDGTSAVRHLSEHPDAARYRGKLSSGQLWTLDDEQDWVLEAQT